MRSLIIILIKVITIATLLIYSIIGNICIKYEYSGAKTTFVIEYKGTEFKK